MQSNLLTRDTIFEGNNNNTLIIYFAKKKLQSLNITKGIEEYGAKIHLVDTQNEFISILKKKKPLMLIIEDALVLDNNLNEELFYGLLSVSKIPIIIGIGEENKLSKIKSINFDSILSPNDTLENTLNVLQVFCEACKIISSSESRIKKFSDFNFKEEELHSKIQEELQHKNRRISALYMQIIEYRKMFKKSFNEWRALDFSLADDKTRRFHFSLKSFAKEVESEWDTFSEHFVEVHPSFFEKLKNLASNLSDENLKMCAYIKMGIGNHEIANFMNIQYGSVKRAQVRIKNKLQLDKDLSLRNFIKNL
jgi:hypothetical protein